MGSIDRIVWAPQAGPQTRLLSCPVEDILFGGARGGGKSDAILGDFAAHAARSNGHASGILLRRTTPQLEEIIQRAKEIYYPLGAQWLAGVKTWLFPCQSRLKLRWLERDEDADHYQGHQYSWVGIDEVGIWPSPGPVDKLRATLRSPYGVPCVTRMTANPGGIGQQWLKERYIDPAAPMTPFFDERRRVWRVFIPSNVRDNKILMDADPGYVDRLKSSGPPWLVRAWLEGDWSAASGDSFFAESAILIDREPVPYPDRCDYVFAIVDTAVKDGLEHDGTAVAYFAKDRRSKNPLTILDWDVLQIEGRMLESWLPSVYARLESLARITNARSGSAGAWIEDKVTGTVLLQNAMAQGDPAEAIPSKLTTIGKEARAVAAAQYVYRGEVKISKPAYDKVSLYKDETKNHFLSQVCGFRLGIKTPHQMDALDTFCYGVLLGLGDSDGF